ncbi:ABC transporter substrate-binding protein [Streptomyces sp. AF1B]|uniref:ABC transporter substrate-binding protein n=1 Tax=Streptomyces sp. AF1B TaxID=3399503 RepID=UPI003AAABB60
MRLHPRPMPAVIGCLPSAASGRRAMAIAGATVLSSALLTACGNSAATGTDVTTTVTVGVAGNIFDVPLRLADDQGYFAKHGLKVRFETVTAATGTPALESGSLQFLNSSPTSFLSAVAKGRPETAIGVDGLGNPLGLVVSKQFAKLHGLKSKSSAVQVAQALAGSTGGFSSANTKAESEILLKSKKVDPGKVKWVSLPSPSADEAALKDGRIDWFVTSEPLPLQIQHSGDGIVVANSQTVYQWAGDYAGYGQVVVARKSYASQHTAVVKQFIAAVREGSAYLNKHGNDPSVIPVAKEALPGVPDPVLHASIMEVEWPLFMDMDSETWRQTFDFVSELGALPQGADVTADDWSNDYLR